MHGWKETHQWWNLKLRSRGIVSAIFIKTRVQKPPMRIVLPYVRFPNLLLAVIVSNAMVQLFWHLPCLWREGQLARGAGLGVRLFLNLEFYIFRLEESNSYICVGDTWRAGWGLCQSQNKFFLPFVKDLFWPRNVQIDLFWVLVL